MAVDITTIPIEELLDDILEAQVDTTHCQVGLLQGVKHLDSGASVQHRLDTNIMHIAKIREEIERRVNLTKEEA